MNTKTHLYKFLPKYSELDAYITLLLLSLLFIFSDIFRDWFLNSYFGRLDSDGFIASISVLIALGMGTYYTFQFKKTIPKKSQHFVIGMIALLMSILNIVMGIVIIRVNMSLDTNIFTVIANFFVAINVIRGLTTYILLRMHDEAEEFLYQSFNVKPWQVVLITIIVPVTLYLSLVSSKNINDILIIFINVYGFSSLAIYILGSLQIDKN
jgi:hypothetical protein